MAEFLIGAAAGMILVAVAWARFRSRPSSLPLSVDPSLAEPSARDKEDAQRLRRMIDETAEGVVFFSETGGVALANAAARRMFSDAGLSVEPVIRSAELMSVVRRVQSSGVPQDSVVSLWPGRDALNVRAVPVGEEGVIAVLRDVGEEQRLSLVRRQFVVSASHEMKTPVTAIQALAEAGQQALETRDLDTAMRFVANLGDEAARLGRLVQDLLDLSRVEDPTNISREPVELGMLAADVVAQYGSTATEKGVELKVSTEPELWVRGDGSQLRLAVKNLVDNALRYTAEGAVLVDMAREGGQVVLRVSDTGTGIPLSAQSRVFERFFRVDEARDRARGGTGLGLSIVKHVVDLHGGRIVLESELGEGSTFSLFLPSGESGDG